MEEKTNYKIIIADDHPIFRKGLVKILEEDVTFNIIGETGDGRESLKMIRELTPDIAVLDIDMPNMTGIDIAREVQKEKLKTEIIILTMYKEEEYLNEALDLDVKGFLLKDSISDELLDSLKIVAKGKHYISPEISDFLIDRKTRAQSLLKKSPPIASLTSTEKKILKMISENKTSSQIADEMFVSVRTVQNHRNNICQKLGISGHNKLLQFALENKSIL